MGKGTILSRLGWSARSYTENQSRGMQVPHLQSARSEMKQGRRDETGDETGMRWMKRGWMKRGRVDETGTDLVCTAMSRRVSI
jgi:hypothetical protein